jgi:hypothetical protein
MNCEHLEARFLDCQECADANTTCEVLVCVECGENFDLTKLTAKRESKKMDQKEWLEYELQQITKRVEYAPSDKDYCNGYADALTNALNNLSGMTPNSPELPSGYLPGAIKNQTLTPDTLRVIADDLEREGITGLNVALALDLITSN